MIRFLHFMPIPSPIFNRELIKLINENINGENEHQFILSDKNCYLSLKEKYSNIIFEQSITLSTIYKYNTHTVFIIFHSLFLNSRKLLLLKKSVAAKISWCIWGHDLYRNKNYSPSFIGKIFSYTGARYICNYLADKKVGCFRQIIAGYKADEIEIRKRFGGNIKIINALYPCGYFSQDIDRIIHNDNKTRTTVNIMVGHCAIPFLQHKKLLDRLLNYKNENICIVLVLSYGIEEYRNEVIFYAEKLFGKEKINVITDFLPWNKYIELLNNIDIAIFDYEHQAAFGNIIALSYLKKKIFLSKTGVMYQGLLKEHVDIYDCNEIGYITFSNFCSITKQKNNQYISDLLDKNMVITQWKYVFEN